MPSRIFSNSFYVAFASILLIVACRSVKGTNENCREDEKTCEGNMVNICLDGKWTVWDDCSSLNMTCKMFAGSAECTATMADLETENDSTSDDTEFNTDIDSDVDSDIDTDSVKVITETTANVCNCVSRLFNSEPGISWMKDSCVDNIHEDCLSCYDQKIGGRSCSDLDFEEIAIAMAECADQCPEPITTPSNREQCLDLIFNSAMKGTDGTIDVFADCVCSKCFDSFQACLSNQSCAVSLACLMTQTDTCVDGDCGSTLTECEKVFLMNSKDDGLSKMNAFASCIYFDQKCVVYLK